MKISISFEISNYTNDNGMIPWWFIVVTMPVPGITAPMIAFNMAALAKRQAAKK